MSDTDRVQPPLEYFRVPLPMGSNAVFLRKFDLFVGIRNAGPVPVMLHDLRFTFQPAHRAVDEALVTSLVQCHGRVLQPSEETIEQFTVCPSLVMHPATNYCHFQVSYSIETPTGHGARERIALGSEYLIIADPPSSPSRRCPPYVATVFISFKDSEDLTLATVAADLLRRAGFVPYLARDDERMGADYWAAKIEPAIRSAEGVLVIWTPNSVHRPESVLRELNCALSAHVPVGLFLEEHTRLPIEYPAHQREYGGPFRRDSAFPEFAREIEACVDRWRKGQPLFGAVS
jgi:hypothetical protein